MFSNNQRGGRRKHWSPPARSPRASSSPRPQALPPPRPRPGRRPLARGPRRHARRDAPPRLCGERRRRQALPDRGGGRAVGDAPHPARGRVRLGSRQHDVSVVVGDRFKRCRGQVAAPHQRGRPDRRDRGRGSAARFGGRCHYLQDVFPALRAQEEAVAVEGGHGCGGRERGWRNKGGGVGKGEWGGGGGLIEKKEANKKKTKPFPLPGSPLPLYVR